MAYGIGHEALHMLTYNNNRSPIYALVDGDGDFIMIVNDLDMVTDLARDAQRASPKSDFTVIRMVGIALPKTAADAAVKTAEMLLQLILKRMGKTKADMADMTPDKMAAVLDEMVADFDFKNAPDAALREAGERLDAALKRDREARAKAKASGSKS